MATDEMKIEKEEFEKKINIVQSSCYLVSIKVIMENC